MRVVHYRVIKALVVASALALACAAGAAAQTALSESGSTLLYPLMQVWATEYERLHAGVTISAEATGSGAGISKALAGSATIGGSDAYLSDAQRAQGAINIPLAVSAQQIDYNLPQLNTVRLRLSGPVLAGIYSGRVRNWDDPALTALNPGVPLPHHAIVPIRRAEGSGDTFLFTQYLSFSDPSWEAGANYGTRVRWPAVAGEQQARGNAGVLELCKNAPYSIAYVGISFFEQARAAGVGYAALRNRDGAFVEPAAESIEAATRSARVPGDGRVSLVFRPGRDVYPIVNFEYAVVKTHQPDTATAERVRAFLSWIVEPQGGNANSFLQPVHFVPLPADVLSLSKKMIASIGG